MLKTGVFLGPDFHYQVTEVTETGYYRLDIMNENARYQIDTDQVIFSLIRKKRTYTYGDNKVYDAFLKLQSQVADAKMNTTKEAKWEDGVYVTKTHSYSDKYNYSMDTTKHNGLTVYTFISDGVNSISLSTQEFSYGVKVDPLNFEAYTELTISKDTVNTSNSTLFYDIGTLRRRYDIQHIYEKDFVVATDLETARARLKDFDENPYPLRGFDTETTGLDVDLYGDDEMVGIVLGTTKEVGTYFPFRHKGDFNLPYEFLDELMQVVLKWQDKLVAHNKKFDRKVMRKEGYDLHIKWCTMQISIVLNPTLEKGVHGLKYLMNELNGHHYLELDEIFMSSKDIDFSILPVEIIQAYACADPCDCLELIEDQFKKLKPYQHHLVALECALSDVKADQEYFGIRVDINKYVKAYQNCNYIIDVLLKAFRTLTKEDGNIGSPQVLLPLLYEKMKCQVLMRTKKGQPSTSSLAVKKLAKLKADKPRDITEDLTDMYGNTVIKATDLANSKYPALVILAKYREYNKLKTAFYARFERTIKTGRVFFWVNQNGAATGRQSSPMHQLPPDLKEVILSDAPNRDFWGPDFSQIELRMIAYLAGETDLIELAKDPDNDIHRIIGSLISNKEMWAITKEERSTGKRRNFGVVYLISAMGLAGQIFGPGYTKENVEFCQQQLDDFYHKFKRIDRFIKMNAELVQKQGYMETAWYRRRRLFPQIFDKNLEPSKRSSILRQANNVPVQGTAADYLKLAEIQMQDYIYSKGWDKLVDGFPMVRQMLSIHDEIIISAHQDIPIEEITEMITKCMETPVDDAPPFFVQPARMDNWEGHSDDSVAMPIRFRDKIIADYNKTHVSIFKRSYFDIVVPEDIIPILNDQKNVSTKTLVKEYVDRCSLKFNHGDYVKEAEQKHVKEALANYINSGFTTYCIDNYRELLNSYRNNDLKDYMVSLIKQYGSDYHEVGAHVRHPSLTHELLDYFKKELKGLGLSHEEQITEAARLYIEELNNGGVRVEEIVEEAPKKVIDKDLFNQQLEASINYDDEGNVIYYDGDEEDEWDMYDPMNDDPDPESIIKQVSDVPIYAWELADNITYDVQGLDEESVNRLLSYIYDHRDDNGFYQQFLIYNNKLVNTNIRVETPNVSEANDIIINLHNSEKEKYAW